MPDKFFIDTKPETRNLQLDGLRAFAFALVTLSHIGLEAPYIHLGQAGVGIFFVLSSMLITSILLDAKSPSNRQKSSNIVIIRNFFARRMLRLYPLLICVIGISVVTRTSPFPETWPWHTLYLSNIYQYCFGMEGYGTNLWSLSVEEQFYLLWPPIVLLCPNRRLPKIIAFLFFFSVLSRFFLSTPEFAPLDRKGDPNLLLCSHFDCLSCGAWLSFHQKGMLNSRHQQLLFTLPLLAFVLWISLTPFTQFGPIRESMLAFFWLLMVHFCCKPLPKFLAILLTNKLMVYLGRISYGLYVIQGVVLGWLMWFLYTCPIPGYRIFARLGVSEQIYTSPPFLTMSCLLLNLIFAVLFWHIVEVPINRFKRYFP